LLAAILHFGIAYPLILLMLAVVAIHSGEKNFINIMTGMGLGVAGLVVLIFATWTTNTGNLYSNSLVLKLMPEPPAYSSCKVSVPEEDDLAEFVEILRPLRASNVISNYATFHNILLEIALSPNREEFKQSRKSMTDDDIKKMAAAYGGGWWNMRLAFYGPKKVNEANWEFVQDAYAKIPGARFKADHFDTPLKPDDDSMDYSAKMQAGLPNMEGFAAMSWRTSGHGHVDLFSICPITGDDAMKQYTMYRDTLREFGLDYMSTFIVAPRCMYHGIPLHVLQGDPDKKAKLRELFNILVKKAADAGYGEYRAHLAFMDSVAGTYSFNDNALLRFNERIKETLDPKGILSPGKQGIWPEHMREDRK
jgi:4-cresol dehydrogenase (hydroxylating)